VKHGYTLCT